VKPVLEFNSTGSMARCCGETGCKIQRQRSFPLFKLTTFHVNWQELEASRLGLLDEFRWQLICRNRVSSARERNVDLAFVTVASS